jgi:ABC-type transport system involved in multi-copper enzyme maturation permease subunit
VSIRRILQVARFEWFDAVRSRRAIVVLVLYLAASLLSMNGAITVLGKMESQLAEVLQLPADGSRGVVSVTLWKSKRFQKMVRSALGDSLVYDDICGRHPAELLYAWFAFFYVPLLTVLVAGNRAADELHSGSVRYMIIRVTRIEWSLGKYIGISALLLVGLLFGSVAAWGTAAYRLFGADISALFPAMLVWGVKAWIYSFAWLGLALGISHFVQSGAKATALGIAALVVWFAAPPLLERFAGEYPALTRFFPGGVEDALWRSSFEPIASAALWLLALGILYLSAGIAVFAGRDAR